MKATKESIEQPLSCAIIGLGSNIEPRLEYLRRASTMLETLGEIPHKSPIYETAPVGGVPQPNYLNAVVELTTTLGPLELAHALKSIEQQLGRKRRPRWHEREIDLDLLFYDDLVLESAELTIPHKEGHRRAFVLVPMNDIEPNFRHPILHNTIAELLSHLDPSDVSKTELSLDQ